MFSKVSEESRPYRSDIYSILSGRKVPSVSKYNTFPAPFFLII